LSALKRGIGFLQGGDNIHGGREHLLLVAALKRVVPALSLLGGEEVGVSLQQPRHESIHLGVIGDHQPIQGARELGAHPGGRGDFLAAGEAVGVLLTEAAHGPRVHGDLGVQVLIAPEGTRRISAADVGREFVASKLFVDGISRVVVLRECRNGYR
jgi:hypothetical protein